MSPVQRLSPVPLVVMALLCAVTLAICPTVLAQTPAEPKPLKTLEEAAAQREQASRLRDAAEETHKLESAACYKKILVNDCLAGAKQRYTKSIIEARDLDTPARDFQREVRRADIEAKAAQRAADQAQRKQKQQADAEAYRAEQAAKNAKRDKKLAERAARQRRQATGNEGN